MNCIIIKFGYRLSIPLGLYSFFQHSFSLSFPSPSTSPSPFPSLSVSSYFPMPPTSQTVTDPDWRLDYVWQSTYFPQYLKIEKLSSIKKFLYYFIMTKLSILLPSSSISHTHINLGGSNVYLYGYNLDTYKTGQVPQFR